MLAIKESQEKMDAIFLPFKKRGFTLKKFRNKTKMKGTRKIKYLAIYCYILSVETDLSVNSIAKLVLRSDYQVKYYIRKVKEIRKNGGYYSRLVDTLIQEGRDGLQ